MSFNLYLHENKACNAEYFFFNAAHYPEAFRTTLLEPFCFNEDKMLRSIFLASASLIYTSQTFNTPFFKFSLIIKGISNSYSPLSLLSYLNRIIEWPNFNLLFCLIIIEGRFLETFHDFQNSRIEIMNIEEKMPFLSTIMNSLGSGFKGNE
ncbi:XXYS1_4_G0042950.mRNA.1.CDS.1 [Saccharomyces cerevisiae]|nr:XXYS1_4_G0042950.mRNA.1.CDS.1 [Saccharomyces cerevisiae]